MSERNRKKGLESLVDPQVVARLNQDLAKVLLAWQEFSQAKTSKEKTGAFFKGVLPLVELVADSRRVALLVLSSNSVLSTFARVLAGYPLRQEWAKAIAHMGPELSVLWVLPRDFSKVYTPVQVLVTHAYYARVKPKLRALHLYRS